MGCLRVTSSPVCIYKMSRRISGESGLESPAVLAQGEDRAGRGMRGQDGIWPRHGASWPLGRAVVWLFLLRGNSGGCLCTGVLGRSHFGVWNMPTWPRQDRADPPVSGHRGLRGGVVFALHSPRSRAHPAARSAWTRGSSFREMLFQKAWVGIESPCFWQAPMRRMPHTGTPGAVVSCCL